MEVMPGYRQTEVGVIPEDWSVKTISQISDPVRGGSPRPAGDPRYFNGTYIPWLTVAALTNIPASHLVVTETVSCLTEEGSLHSRTLNEGTLIIANSGATLGVAKILGIKCCANDGIAALLNISKDVDPVYLAHYINTKTNYLRDVVATGNGQPNLNTDLIGRFKFPLPPTKSEQEAIAEFLSKADALIESHERLIAKKRHLKKGVMQQLLTGRQRLCGFADAATGYKQTDVGVIPEDWYVAPLGELISSLDAGVSVNSVDREKDVFAHEESILKTSCVLGGKFFPEEHKKIIPRDVQRAKLNPRADTIIISRMNTPALVGECGYVSRDYPNLFLPDRLWMTRFDGSKPSNARWLAYLLSFSSFNRVIKESATGTSGSMKNISKDSLLSVQIPLPSKAEQDVIAEVLGAMDAEIALLEAQLAKYHQLKQGLMQKLITGRIRLV